MKVARYEAWETCKNGTRPVRVRYDWGTGTFCDLER
jgi:hypothetical protein